MSEREFWLAVRQALLLLLDAIERGRLDMRETTAEIRRQHGRMMTG